jgi:hypothetical protein
MAQLTSADLELIENYKKAKVLDKIDSHLLDPREGLSIIMCGDPDQHPEAYSYHQENIVKAGCLNRIHPPAPLGGALRLVPHTNAIIGTVGYDRGLLFDLALVRQKKNIKTFALYVHAPCAMAELLGMKFEEIMRTAFEAKRKILAELPGIKAAVFCHIDDGQKKQTWFVCRKLWEQYHSNSLMRLKLLFPNRVSLISTPQASM